MTFSPVVIMTTENTLKFLCVFLPCLTVISTVSDHKTITYYTFSFMYLPLVPVLDAEIFLMFITTLCQIAYSHLDGLKLLLYKISQEGFMRTIPPLVLTS